MWWHAPCHVRTRTFRFFFFYNYLPLNVYDGKYRETYTHATTEPEKRNLIPFRSCSALFFLQIYIFLVYFIVHRPLDIKNRPRIPIPDEDPYSIAGNGGGSGSSGSSGFGNSNNAPGLSIKINFSYRIVLMIFLSNFKLFTGHVAATREQLLLQTQKLASRRSEKPPKLPPRDNIYHPHDIPKPDYDDINEDDRFKAFRVKSDKGRDLNKKYGKSIQ